MAIAMQRRMAELQSEWLDMGLERPFQQRIGINTGFCTVGNFGSADRMDYTIIGNEVNLTARLEALAKVGGILLAHETHSLVKDIVMAEEGDTLTVIEANQNKRGGVQCLLGDESKCQNTRLNPIFLLSALLFGSCEFKENPHWQRMSQSRIRESLKTLEI
jgi:hypothetical protein